MTLVGYVVAGGRSRRFGSDKARGDLDGRPLLLHVVEPLRKSTDEVIVVADRAGRYEDLGLVTIADLHPGDGPLAGLEAALADRLARRGPGWVLLVSCDLASLQESWLATLADFASSLKPTDAIRAVAFRDSRWQPFPGAYHSSLLPLLSEALARQSLSFQGLLSDPCAGARALSLPADWPEALQVNTQEDLARIRAQSQVQASAPSDGTP